MSESEQSQTNAGAGRELELRAAAAPFALSQEPHTPEGQFELTTPIPTPAPAFEHLGELPASYGTQSLYLVAYDPRQLFAYWDVDWSAAGGKQYVLQVLRADGSVETRIDLSATESSRYIPIRETGARYSVELTVRGRDGQWRTLATSGPVMMPPEGVADESEPAFATLPFHLSFQRLIDLLHGAMRPNEELTDVLARLQSGGHPDAGSLLGALGSLGQDQLRTLEMLLRDGFDPFEASGPNSGGVPGMGSGGLSSPGTNPFGRFGGAGSETLSSGGALSSGALAVGAASSGLMNSELRLAAAAAGAESFSSAGLSSQGRWQFGSLSSETLSSRMRGPLYSAAGMGSESLASGSLSRRVFSAAGGLMSSESLNSARSGLSSGAYATAAARGSEILGSASRPGFGLSSEAWRRAGGFEVGGGSEMLSSGGQSSLFLRAMEINLEVLSSLFSRVDSQLNGELGGSSSLSSSTSGW